MVKEPPLGLTAAGNPASPHRHPFSVMQKGLYLEMFWMQREALTQPGRLLAAVTSSCPQPRQRQTEETRMPATNPRSKREELQNATHLPRHSHSTEMVWVLCLCLSRPIPAPTERG